MTKKTTTVRLPTELHRRAEMVAAAQNRTLAALIEDGLCHIIATHERVTARASATSETRIMPRVSIATGGLVPGLDASVLGRIQEIDDLAYAERMKRFE